MLTRLSAKRRFAVLAATLAALLAIGLQPALASEGAGVVVGGGTISPGLSLDQRTQSVSFGGTAVLAGVDPADAAVATCNFSGGSIGTETAISGTGSVSGTCSTADGRSGACTGLRYYRVGPHVGVSGTCGGYVSGNLGGVFVFVPTSGPTVTSYQLLGGVALSSTVDPGTPIDIVGGAVTGALDDIP